MTIAASQFDEFKGLEFDGLLGDAYLQNLVAPRSRLERRANAEKPRSAHGALRTMVEVHPVRSFGLATLAGALGTVAGALTFRNR